MAILIQLLATLAGVGFFGYIAFSLMNHGYLIRKSAAKTNKMIGETFESISKRLEEHKRLQQGNSDLLLMLEDLRREIKEREL